MCAQEICHCITCVACSVIQLILFGALTKLSTTRTTRWSIQFTRNTVVFLSFLVLGTMAGATAADLLGATVFQHCKDSGLTDEDAHQAAQAAVTQAFGPQGGTWQSASVTGATGSREQSASARTKASTTGSNRCELGSPITRCYLEYSRSTTSSGSNYLGNSNCEVGTTFATRCFMELVKYWANLGQQQLVAQWQLG